MTVKLAFIIEVEPQNAQAVAAAIQQALAPLGAGAQAFAPTAAAPLTHAAPAPAAPLSPAPGAYPSNPGMQPGFQPPAGQPQMPPAMPQPQQPQPAQGGVTAQSVYPLLQAYAGTHKADGVMRVFARYGVNPPRLDAASPEQLAMISQHFASMQPA